MRPRGAIALVAAGLCAVFATSAAGQETPGSLTLEQALAMAREGNQDLGILAEHLEKSEAVRVQVLSGMLPWITASASVGFAQEVTMSTSGGTNVIVPGTDWGFGGKVSLALLHPSLYPALVASGKSVKASSMLLDHGTEQVLYATAQSYVTAAFADAAVVVRTLQLETREKRLEEVEARLEADDALLLDVSRAELQLLQSKKALETARVDAMLAMDALCLIMGQKPGTSYKLAPLQGTAAAAPEVPPTEVEMQAQLEEASGNRSDLDALELAVEAAKAQKLSSWFGLLPALSVSASYDKGPESFRAPDGVSWTVSFNMTWVLLDGGYTAGKILEQSSETEEALLSFEKAGNTVESEVRAAWLLFGLAITNRDTAIKELEVSGKVVEMAEEKYKAGLASGLEVDDALDELAVAEMGLLGQEMNLQLAWMEYLRASGQFEEVFGIP